MKSIRKRNKIVICANSSWYIYNFRKNTIKSLVDMGYEVYAVASKDNSSKKLSKICTKYYQFKLKPNGVNPLSESLVIMKLFVIYLVVRPAFVMNFTPKMNIYSSIVSFFFMAKVINNISGLGTVFSDTSFLSRFTERLYKFSQLFATKIFFQNENDLDMFVSKKIAPRHKCEYIPGSGVNLKTFSVCEAPDDHVVRFLIVCRMLYKKGIVEFADAAKHIKDKYGHKVEFRAIGFIDPDNKYSISEQIMKNWVTKDILTYGGALDDVRKEISLSDCVVLPSVYPEGTPKSLLEAGAMGKPIITTNMPGCSSTVIDGSTGFLCDPGSTHDLIAKIEKIISMTHQDRYQMGLRSRRHIEKKFDEKIVIKKYLNCLK